MRACHVVRQHASRRRCTRGKKQASKRAQRIQLHTAPQQVVAPLSATTPSRRLPRPHTHSLSHSHTPVTPYGARDVNVQRLGAGCAHSSSVSERRSLPCLCGCQGRWQGGCVCERWQGDLTSSLFKASEMKSRQHTTPRLDTKRGVTECLPRGQSPR